MSGERVDGGPAFPNYKPYAPSVDGMSLRDYFAAQALNGIIPDCGLSPEEMAERCYEAADAMLAARAKP